MERRHEENVISTLDLIGLLALELPIGVIDENQDPRPTTALGELAASSTETLSWT